LIDFYFIANDVDGLPSGGYYYDQETESAGTVETREIQEHIRHLSLGQPTLSQVSVMFFLTTDLNHVAKSYGNRVIVLLSFVGGVRAGKLYLSSYSLGLGASGSTFYDDAVTEFFSPHGEHANPMIAGRVGVPGIRRDQEGFFPSLSRDRGRPESNDGPEGARARESVQRIEHAVRDHGLMPNMSRILPLCEF